ncbi:MAG: hypothetical protein IMZ53_14975 [Thermoplasmata archaeon]|nr:hypothetical protein [Thermoplasmata archaeon]
MKITITINTENAAFEDNPGEELSRILLEQSDKVRLYPLDGNSAPFGIRDYNGNVVGHFTVEK